MFFTQLGDARLVEIRASIPGGIASTFGDWQWLLDGLLAGVARQHHPARTRSHNGRPPVDHHTVSLPFSRLKRNMGAQWVWAASQAVAPSVYRETRMMAARTSTDLVHTMAGANAPKDMPSNGGRYKSWHVPVFVDHAPEWVWHAVGDPEAIHTYLRELRFVGDRRASGYGQVEEWAVTDRGSCDETGAAEWVLWHGGTISRPVPARAAGTYGIPADAETVGGVIRPPYWRPPLAQSGGYREPREVIASWTTKQRSG